MPATSPSGDSGVVDAFAALSPEEQERQREEWKQDLARVRAGGGVKGCVGLFGSEAHLDDCFSVV